MNPIVAYLKAFRYKNLVIIALTMVLMRYGVFIPFIEVHQLEPQMSHTLFAVLVLSVVLGAAGGYIINDYFDLKIDRINKPHKIIVGRYIKRRVAIVAHWVIHGLGFAMGFYVAWRVGLWQLSLIHIFWILAMWFYSVDFKRHLIVGNVVMALCLALVPMSVFLFEWPTIEFFYGPQILKIAENYEAANQSLKVDVGSAMMELGEDPRMAFAMLRKNLFMWFLGFSGFAFLLSLAREITKDAADLRGDKAYGCVTIPIKWGLTVTKTVVLFLYLIVGVAILGVQQLFLYDKLTLTFILVLLLPLLGVTSFYTLRANDSMQFTRASTWNKMTSVVGLLYAMIVYYQLSGVGV